MTGIRWNELTRTMGEKDNVNTRIGNSGGNNQGQGRQQDAGDAHGG